MTVPRGSVTVPRERRGTAMNSRQDDPQVPDSPGEKENGASIPARFEESLAELEKLVENLERGDLSLEDSLEQFERGVVLARQCRESLTAAEQKVRVLIEREGGEELADFDPDTAADDP